MNFNESYKYMENLIMSQDFSNISKDFTAMLYLTGEESGYIYMSYINGVKKIEPVKHDSANIYITMSLEVFEKLVNGQSDVLRAFTTGKIQAKGNVILALAIYNSFK